MHHQSLRIRAIRKLFYIFSRPCLFQHSNWGWLKHYPAIEPNPEFLEECTQSDSEVYQKWLDKHVITTYDQWHTLRIQARTFKRPPRLSIITPVFNTKAAILEACIFSVRTQCYPYWQLILIDDGSHKRETLNVLNSSVCHDPRIQVIQQKNSQGISAASNTGIQSALGDYVLFLDHDDRLSMDALYHFGTRLIEQPETDVIYSDRDMITPEDDLCTLHLFKPGWSPEQLLSGNYLFHLMGYRRTLLLELGGLRPEYDGSQDYDLILRASDRPLKVEHVTQVLYHWRQHDQSVALNENAKDYAFEAGQNALKDCLKRRHIQATVREINSLWRGNYELVFSPLAPENILQVRLPPALNPENYAETIQSTIQKNLKQQTVIAIISESIRVDESQIAELASWLQLPEVGLASPRIDSDEGNIVYAGWAFKRNADIIAPYAGFPTDEPGYMAATRITRNISAPHPFCVLIDSNVWRQLNGFRNDIKGHEALLDFALRAHYQQNCRAVFVPQFRWLCANQDSFRQFEKHPNHQLYSLWQSTLAEGDPYYNPNLNEHSHDMGLDV